MNAGDNNGQARSAIALAVHRELICLLFGSPSVPLINGVVALVTAGVLWRIFPFWISLSWLLVSLFVIFVRLILWWHYNKRRPGMGDMDKWARQFTLTTAVTGCLWGLVASTSFVAAEPIHYLFAAFVVGGLCAGAAIRLAPHPPAFYAYIGTSAPPMVFTLLMHGSLISSAMGGLLLTFIVVMILVGRENQQRLADYIHMKIEQETLNANLQKVTLDLTEQNVILRERSELLDKAQDAIFVQDMESRILYWNQGAERLFGWSAAEVMGLHVGDIFQSSAQEVRRAFSSVVQQGEWVGEISKKHKAGRDLIVESRCTLVRTSDNTPHSILAINTDITNRKAADARIHNLAFHDVLTGLPNRTLLRERLEKALAATHELQNCGALVLIDLDDFKTLNDTSGHDLGDRLLQEVATRLKSCIRSSDTAARLGGDEFVVMLLNLSKDPETANGEAKSIGETIVHALQRPYLLQHQEYEGTASVGATLFQGRSETVDDLLKRADLAMYQAKAQGRNRLCLFDPAMESTAASRVELLADLKKALANDEFELYYQPQVTTDRRVVGCEALLRWRHPLRGMVPPNEFIPLAEADGLIVELGYWVLDTACLQLAAWAQQPGMGDLHMAVNVSIRRFFDSRFVPFAEKALRMSGANPKRLKLEITESFMTERVHDVIAKMSALKAHGIGFSMDDFGTGYSSLSQLKRLPLDQLKIDQSFVRDVLNGVRDASIVRTIIALGQSLDLAIIAEGVETERQREFLEEHGCYAYRGYLFSPALPFSKFAAFVDGMHRSQVQSAA